LRRGLVDDPVIRWDVVNNDRTVVYAATKSLLQRLQRMFAEHALKCEMEKDHLVVEGSFPQIVRSCEAELSVVLLKGEKRSH
jgi:hypothetical protein